MGVIKRQSLKGSIVSYLGIGFGALFFLIILPNILEERYLGFYQLVFSVVSVFSLLPLLGLANVLFRYYTELEDENRINAYNSYAFTRIIGAGLLFGILFFLFKDQLVKIYPNKSELFTNYYYIIPPLVILQALTFYLDYYCMVKLRVAVPTFIREILTRFLLISTFCLLALHFLSEIHFILFYVLTYVISFIALFYYTYKNLGFRFGHAKLFKKGNKHLKAQFSYAANAMGMAFISTFQNFSDAIILPMYLGLGALGIYGRPMILGAMINVPYRSIAYIAQPIILEAWNNNDIKKIADLNRKLSINLLLIGLFIFSIIVVNADNFFAVLPDIYSKEKTVLYIIAFGRLLDMSFGLNSEILFSSKYYRWMLYFTILSFIVTILLNIYLINIYGMNGAALAVTAALITFNGLKTIFIYKKFGFHCFTKKYLSMILFASCAIAITTFIPDFYSQALNERIGSFLASIGINVLIKSISCSLLFIIPLIYFKTSDDFNAFFSLIISGKIFKGGHKMEDL